MSDEEFAALLAACGDELALLQSQFQQRIGTAGRWFYDLSVCTLTVGTEVFSITPIGTYSAEYESWLWAWANGDFPALARERSERLKQLFKVTGFRVFVVEGIAASSSDAQNFAALAVRHLKAIGIFKVPTDGPTLFLAVHELAVQRGWLRAFWRGLRVRFSPSRP